MRIAIVYSLPTRRALATPYKATDEDTKDSAEEVAAALTAKGASVELVPVDEDSIDRIKKISADVIFNLVEWDGLDTPLTLVAFDALEATHIPYTGSTKAVVSVCNDKANMKAALDEAGLPTPRWQLFCDGRESVRSDLVYPVIIKLAWEHCSVGLTRQAVIDRREDLPVRVTEHIASFGQPVFIEEFVGGREFQVTILEKNGVPRVLPPAEIVFHRDGKDSFLTFESRWDESHPDYTLSTVKKAVLSSRLAKRLEQLSLVTHRILAFRDYSRMDIRARGEEPLILEANANPGLGDSDDYGMTVSYRAAGMNFADFIWKIVESCLRRRNRQ